MVFLYDVFKSKKLPTNIGFKKSKNIQFVTIFTIEKLQRWIATVSIQIYQIYLNDFRTGINRLGSHCTEQQMGQVRSFCYNDHRLNKIVHACAVLCLIKKISKELFKEVPRKKKLNRGGCQLNPGRIKINFGDSVDQVANIILGILGYIEKPSKENESKLYELYNYYAKIRLKRNYIIQTIRTV